MASYHSGELIHNSGSGLISLVDVSTCNLLKVTVDIPKRALTVVTGPAGSGKSALVVGTLQAEAERRVKRQSKRSVARSFVPEFKALTGLLPVVNLNELSQSPLEGTVSSLLGIGEKLTVLAREKGQRRCGFTGCQLKTADPDTVIRTVNEEFQAGGKHPLGLTVAALFRDLSVPKAVLAAPASFPEQVFAFITYWQQRGYSRFLIDETIYDLPLLASDYAEASASSAAAQFVSALRRGEQQADIGVVVDRIIFDGRQLQRLRESLLLALNLGSRLAAVVSMPGEEGGERLPLRKWIAAPAFFCDECGRSFEARELEQLIAAGRLARAAQPRENFDYYIAGRSCADLEELIPCELLSFLEKNGFEAGDALKTALEMLAECTVLKRRWAVLSPGEKLKLALAMQLARRLTNILFVADQPSSVLHPRDLRSFYEGCRRLIDQGNTVVCVEAHPQFVACADQVVELGFADERGKAELKYSGAGNSWTSPRPGPPASPLPRQSGSRCKLVLYGGDGEKVHLSGGTMTVLAGTAGSGKTALLERLIAEFKQGKLRRRDKAAGFEDIRETAYLPASPSLSWGRAANFACASGLDQLIAAQFGALPQARRLGLEAAWFSSREGKGVCSECGGKGFVELYFEAFGSARETCERCLGRYFERKVLEVRFRGKSLDEVHNLSVDELLILFESTKSLVRLLQTLQKFGLGGMRPAEQKAQISRSAEQRLEVAAFLDHNGKKLKKGRCLVLMDQPLSSVSGCEPTTLVEALLRVAVEDNIVIVAAHDPALVLASDYVLELNCGRVQKVFASGTGYPLANFFNLGKC